MWSWFRVHRLRFLGFLVVIAAGTALASVVDSRISRSAVFLVCVAFAVGVAGLGTARTVGRRSSGVERDEAGALRDRAADQRDRQARHRDQASEHRDSAADHRDHDADQRDHDANQRDLDADLGEGPRDPPGTGPGAYPTHPDRGRWKLSQQEAAAARTRASHDRGAGASERATAEHDRDAARADRDASANERAHAGLDRDAATADREASAREREYASVDGLTGVYLRSAGFVELAHEMSRARRTNQPLVVAFVDVDHLKAVNDSLGHAAGDRMLREVAQALSSSQRPYDLVLRYGGDEFVCALPGMKIPDAARRFASLNSTLATGLERGSVTIGLAQLRPGDTVEDVVSRADAALIAERKQRRGAAPGGATSSRDA